MRRLLVPILAIAAALAFATAPASAAVTFHKAPPTASFDSNTMTYTVSGFTVSGLGNLPLYETLQVTANYSATCVNRGGNIAPGIKPVSVTSPPITQAATSAHNGTYTFGTLSHTLVAPNPADYNPATYCPNGNWSISSFTLTSTSGTLTIANANGVVYGPISL